MLTQIKDLEKRIEERNTNIKKKSNHLDSLGPKLNTAIEACKPTLQHFEDMQVDDFGGCYGAGGGSENGELLAQYLPKPLYQLYMTLLPYRDFYDNDLH